MKCIPTRERVQTEIQSAWEAITHPTNRRIANTCGIVASLGIVIGSGFLTIAAADTLEYIAPDYSEVKASEEVPANVIAAEVLLGAGIIATMGSLALSSAKAHEEQALIENYSRHPVAIES